jgi:hypothetical protein
MSLKNMNSLSLAVLPALLMAGVARAEQPKTFGDDVTFLKKHVKTFVLRKGNAAVAVVPGLQARVMTSTVDIDKGVGNGWINYELIASHKVLPHINSYGGEDRIWLGPEGGQYSIFFKGGDPFDLEHWQTPPVIDSEGFEFVNATPTSIFCVKNAWLNNYWGTKFDVRMERKVEVLDSADAAKILGVTPAKGVKMVGYQSVNVLKNVGKQAWTKDTGLLSIWILGILKHSATTSVIAPFNKGDVAKLGPVVKDDYFGKVPADRLIIKDGFVQFKADGLCRSKIGLNPNRAKDVIGSYDPKRQLLTIVKFTKPEGVTSYVNSMWAMQDNPYGGDAVNAYNDGPATPGAKPFGPFYEMESSSPAAALGAGESITHISRTFHFVGKHADLNLIAKKVLGVNLDDVKW